MERVGLTNFVLWAIGALIIGVPLAGDTAAALVVGAGALGVAWWTRLWPEGLGVAAGISGAFVLGAVSTLAFRDPGAPSFVPGALLFAATWVVWRLRLGAYVAVHSGAEGASPPAPNGISTPWRLALGTAAAAAALLPLNFVLFLVFAFGRCGSDTNPGPPAGSDLEAYCDFTSDHGAALLLGPSLVVLGLGLVLAQQRRPRLLLITGLAGLALTIAMHIPDWVVSGGA